MKARAKGVFLACYGRLLGTGLHLLLDFLIDSDGDVLMLDVEPKAVEEAHVDVGDPDQGEPGDE